MNRYLGFVDLCRRWIYTRQGVAYLMKSADFPEPDHVVNDGRTKVWDAGDILDYEIDHPEVLNEELKRKKVRAFEFCTREKRRGR